MNISKYFQHRFTLSEDGAKTFIKGVIASLFLNLALILQVIFIFLFITDYLHPVIQAGNSTTHGLWYYVLTALCFMTVLFVIAMIQYKSTYTKIYTESANRRIGIAEKLRKLPLAHSSRTLRLCHQHYVDCHRDVLLQLATGPCSLWGRTGSDNGHLLRKKAYG